MTVRKGDIQSGCVHMCVCACEWVCAYVRARVCRGLSHFNVQCPSAEWKTGWIQMLAMRHTHSHPHAHALAHTHKNYLKYDCPECCFICYEYYCQSTYVRCYRTERNFRCYCCRRLTYIFDNLYTGKLLAHLENLNTTSNATVDLMNYSYCCSLSINRAVGYLPAS